MNDPKRVKLKESVDLLYQVSRIIVSDQYLEEILTLVVGMTAQLMDSKICSLMLLDEQNQELVIKATQSLSEDYRRKPPVKVAESVIGRAVKTRKPVIVPDVSAEKQYQYPDIAKKEELKSLIAVPMMIKERVIGVLNCYTAKPHLFTEDEVQTLIAVANQATVAIENANLLAQKAEALDTLETRKKVDRAKSILIRRYKITEDQAHKLLQKQSMEKRLSLRKIAEAVLVSEDIAQAG